MMLIACGLVLGASGEKEAAVGSHEEMLPLRAAA
jgi:hypothetical protein